MFAVLEGQGVHGQSVMVVLSQEGARRAEVVEHHMTRGRADGQRQSVSVSKHCHSCGGAPVIRGFNEARRVSNVQCHAIILL